MEKNLYQSKLKFKQDRDFQAGYAAVEFAKGSSLTVAWMLIYRISRKTGELVEAGRESICASSVDRIVKRMKPYAA